MKNKYSVLTIGFDKYSDVWPYFSYFFHYYWSECSVDHVFVSNTIQGPSDFKTVVTQNPDAWERFEKGLEEIKTKYCFVLLEDYCLVKNIHNSTMDQLINIMDANGIQFLELTNFITKIKGRKTIVSKPYQIKEIMKGLNYRINLQPSIWETNLLRKIISFKPKTLWDFENMIKSNKYINEDSIHAAYVKTPLFKFCNFIDKGAVSNEAFKYIKIHNLENPKRNKISWCLNIKNKFKRFLIGVLPNSILLKYINRKKTN